MTPETASRLTIHERIAGEGDARMRRRRLAAAGSAAAPASDRQLEVGHPRLLKRESRARRLLGASDAMAATLALAIVLLGVNGVHETLPLLISAPLVILLFKVAGRYDLDPLRLVHSTLDEAPMLVQMTGLYVLWIAIVSPLAGAGEISAARTAALWVTSSVATISGRTSARWLAATVTQVERCLVVGELEVVERVRAKLAASHAHACVVAWLAAADVDCDLWQSPESMRAVAAELRLDRVIIAPGSIESGAVAELVRIVQVSGLRVSVLPRWLEVVGSAVEFDDVDGLTIMGVRPFRLSRSSRVLKRVFDIVVAAIVLCFVATAQVAIAIAIRLDSNGSIIFRQVSVGRDGRRFKIYKFRTMDADAEFRQDVLRSLSEVGDGMFKLACDPRVTNVGGVLRKTSLDELPQLFNVLRGEMSLVGPRPLGADEDARVLGLDRRRLLLTPGITGPWQILGTRVPMQEMLGIDYLYVANWSLWSDIKLLVRTVRHVVRRRNV
jgi:exopolysaccharide biosynthesis polyprenyl glycosylphosphotransferase